MQQRNSEETSQQSEQFDHQKQSSSCIWEYLKNLLAFERSCFSLTSGYPEILQILLVLHTFLGYLLLSQHSLSSTALQLLDIQTSAPALYRIAQGLIHILNTTLIISILAAKNQYKKSIWFSTVKRIFSIYSLLAKLSLFLTSLLLYISAAENAPAMVLAVSASLFDSLFTGNYCSKKEENYQSSHQLSLFLRVGVIAHFIVNCALVSLGQLTAFCVCAAIFGALTLIWHAFGGYRLFLHKVPRTILLLFCAGIISTSTIYLLLVRPRERGIAFNFVEWGVSFLAVLFYLRSFEQKKRFSLVSGVQLIAEEQRMKEYELNLSVLLEESDSDKDKENLLAGIIAYSQKSCRNPFCWSKNHVIYDHLLKREFAPQLIVKEKESALRFYLKCIYDQALGRKKTNERMLDFVEFSLVEMGDFSTHCFVLAELHAREESLGLLERLRLHRLRLILQEQSQAFNRLIYGGRIELDEVLRGEETFELILRDIDTYCRRSVEVWTDAMQREVDVGALKQKLRENFALIPTLNEKWNSLAKFLNVQRHWKHAYLSFALFLKNQKLKNKDLSFNDEDQFEPIPTSDPERVPLRKQIRKEQQISDWVYFDKKATVIMCDMEEGGLRFSKVSRSFESVTGYTEKEVMGSSLNMILPRYLKQSHDSVVNKWLVNGHTTDESNYVMKFSNLQDKNQVSVSVLTLYKLYVNLLCPIRMLNFFGLVKLIGNQRQISLQVNINSNKNQYISGHYTKKFAEKSSHLELNNAKNIFLKQEHLSPCDSITEVERIKQMMRFLTIAIMVLLMTLSIDIRKDVTQLNEKAQAQIIFVNLYNLPFILGKYYQTQVLVPMPLLMSKILQVTNQFKKYQTNPLTTKIIFNQKLTEKVSYLPAQTTAVNQGLLYDSTDIFYLITSCIVTLASKQPKSTMHDYLMFNSYLKPGYDSTINSTKNHLHERLQADFYRLEFKLAAYIGCLTVIMLLALVFLIVKIYCYFKSMNEVMQIIVQFNNSHIENIIDYWQRVQGCFQEKTHLLHKTKEIAQRDSFGEAEIEVKQERLHKRIDQANLNQKTKNLVVSGAEKKMMVKLFIQMVLLIIFFAPILLGLQVVNFSRIRELVDFENVGFEFIKYYPTTGVIGYAMSNRFTSYEPGQTPFNLDRFKDSISNFKILIDYPFQKESQFGSNFQEKRKNYLFGNPCTSNPSILKEAGYSVETCAKLGNSSFSSGLLAYMRGTEPMMTNYLSGKSTIIYTMIMQLSIGYSLVGYYIADAIDTWFNQFSSKLHTFYDDNMILTVIFCVLLLVMHIFIFQLIVLKNLRSDYKFIRSIFCAMVPEHILLNQTIIRHRFYHSGIISMN